MIHDTEGPVGPGAAETVARYFSRETTKASTHLVVDETMCYRCLPNTIVPWGAESSRMVSANTRGFHIEICAYASWTRNMWLAHEQTLRRAAYKTAYHLNLFRLPARWVGQTGLLAGREGITTHADVSAASRKTDPVRWALGHYRHYDPGKSFPKDTFLAFVTEYLVGLQA